VPLPSSTGIFVRVYQADCGVCEPFFERARRIASAIGSKPWAMERNGWSSLQCCATTAPVTAAPTPGLAGEDGPAALPGRTIATTGVSPRVVPGVLVHILQRVLALTPAIWHNDLTDAPVHRSLVAYDH
jgi:hypothetical protein